MQPSVRCVPPSRSPLHVFPRFCISTIVDVNLFAQEPSRLLERSKSSDGRSLRQTTLSSRSRVFPRFNTLNQRPDERVADEPDKVWRSGFDMPLTTDLDPSVPLRTAFPLGKVDKKTVGNPLPAAEADQMGRPRSRSRYHDSPRGRPLCSWHPGCSPRRGPDWTESGWNQPTTRLLSKSSWRWRDHSKTRNSDPRRAGW